ncbi:inhibitor of growth (ING) domain-containing protein [Phanerochaete sordida]|uniref:Chromatin modification-related protein n=1 Tax=Phanerochaete sordida TaxID=48140 RepID=A0A9P3LCH2_9APHY|nr:inhibitor of growth (ING) domain-containing protein [Phanerochaete sordida]
MTSMGPPRSPAPPAPASTSPQKTAHSLAILQEYTHTLDSVPLDLSRNFADLRELDAVLSSSMTTVTSKVIELTNMIENRSSSKEDRLWLLAEIADEVSRLKPGADDKIRVACHAADGLKSHKAHMTSLLQHMPEPEYGQMAGMLSRKTVYPHVATRHYVPAGMAGEGGRRQRRTALLANGPMEATPNKRKRVAADDGDVTRSPAKPKTDASRARNGARRNRNDRAASPAESVLSVQSHLPQAAVPPPMSRQNTSQRAASTASSAKRSRAQNALANGDDSRQEFHHPPSSSHPSLPAPFSNGSSYERNGISEWATGQLEGPGMPVARNFVSSAAASVVPDVDTDAAAGEGDGDGDDGRTYCICDRVSFGEMIACDDENCEKEWFHLACIGLTVAPEGSWVCDSCQARRTTKRPARGGKRRTGGARSGGRNGST